MRRYHIILIMFFHLTVFPAYAAEILLGTVRSVDRESGRLLIEITGPFSGQDGEEITLRTDPEKLPEYVIPGKLIRVWGDYEDEDEKEEFRVRHIRSGDLSRGADPTGVRFRLGLKRRRLGQGRPPPKPPPRH